MLIQWIGVVIVFGLLGLPLAIKRKKMEEEGR